VNFTSEQSRHQGKLWGGKLASGSIHSTLPVWMSMAQRFSPRTTTRLAPCQKISFKANWISRGVFAWLPMIPNVLGLLIFAEGPPNTTRFKMS
jgi:hypothetical protein